MPNTAYETCFKAPPGGADSLGYFALRRDKTAIFSPTGKAAIAYRVIAGVMLASGDPVGDPGAWPGAIEAFLALAYRHAWTPAVIGCSEQGAKVWKRYANLQALELGDEAIIDVAAFDLAGRAKRNVRQMVNRAHRHGYVATIRRLSDLDPAEAAHLQATASSWRGGPVERGYSMALGRLADPTDPHTIMVTAYHNSRLQAFLHFVPWGNDGLSLNLMRRAPEPPPGLNEFMIVTMIQAADAWAIRRLSLNFAIFRSTLELGDRLGAGPILRATRQVLICLSRWRQIQSLYRFNAKFQPTWCPRFICYPKAAELPRITLAALRAERFLPLLGRSSHGSGERRKTD